MPITPRAATTQGADSSANQTVTRPTASVGDLLLAVVSLSHDDSATTVTSSGWNVRLALTAATASGPRWAVLTRPVASGEPSSYTFTKNGGTTSQFIVHCLSLAGVDLDNPIVAGPTRQAGNANTSSIVAASLTAIADSLLLCAFGAEQYVTPANSRSFSTPTGMTELSDAGDVFNYQSVCAEQRGAGTTGTRTATFQTRSSGAANTTPAGTGAVSLVLRSAVTSVAISVYGARSASGGTAPQLAQATPVSTGDARAATAATTVLLAQQSALAARAARSETSATRAALAQASTLDVRSARAAAAATAPRLAQAQSIGARGARSTTQVTCPQAGQTSALLVYGARAASAADTALVVQDDSLIVRDSRAETAATAPRLAQAQAITVRGARADTTAGRASVAQTHPIGVRAATAASAAGRPTLQQSHPLAVRAARSPSSATGPQLGHRQQIAATGARSATQVTRAQLGQVHALQLRPARAETSATRATLVQASTLTVGAARAATAATRPALAHVTALIVQPARAGSSSRDALLAQLTRLLLRPATSQPGATRPQLDHHTVLQLRDARIAVVTVTQPLMGLERGQPVQVPTTVFIAAHASTFILEERAGAVEEHEQSGTAAVDVSGRVAIHPSYGTVLETAP